MKIVSVGECTRDRYTALDALRVGGISLNFSVGARRSGAAVALVSCTGTDAAGDAIFGALAREGVDASHVHRRQGVTASQEIVIGEGGERIFPPGGYDPGVLAGFRLDDDDRAFIATFDVVAAPLFHQVRGLFTDAMEAAGRAHRVIDLLDGEAVGDDLSGLDPLLARADIVFVSGNAALADALCERTRARRAIVVVTHGAGGSTALRRGCSLHEPASPVAVAERTDTTGCGDAFQAAFTVAYFTGGDLAESLHAGALAAARVIRHLGAIGA